VDVVLSLAGLVPPEDPLVFYARTWEGGFSPFRSTGDGHLEIRPDWVNPDISRQVIRGSAAGRSSLHPGFRRVRISERKPPGTVRIFVLGGSCAYGMYLGEEAAFPGRLRQRLTERHPGRPIEVVNLGCVGWASNRVVNLMSRVVELDPDLFIVYSGHNELLQGRVDRGPDIEGSRLRLALLRSSSLYRWIDHAVVSTRRGREYREVREDIAALEAGKSLVFDPTALPVEQRHRLSRDVVEEAARQFGENLRRMVEIGERASVPVLIGRPVANLFTPPTIAAGDVLTRDPSPERTRFLAALGDVEAGRTGDAAPVLASLLDANPEDAGLHYWQGVVLHRLGRPAEATAELQAALDRDVRPHRISSVLEQALLEAGGDRVVDLRPALRGDGSEETAAAMFSDHVHPTVEGHDRIAEALLPEVERRLGW
jgi:lysophospholipase L1-like esterase